VDDPNTPIKKTVAQQLWGWVVVGAIVLFVLGGGLTFMTTDHPWIADAFYVSSAVLFVIKFLTWEDARQQDKQRRRRTFLIAVASTVLVLGGAIAGNHYLNRHSLLQPPNLGSEGPKSAPPVASSPAPEQKPTPPAPKPDRPKQTQQAPLVSKLLDELTKRLAAPPQDDGKPQPIEVELFCDSATLPITIPSRGRAYAVFANEAYNKRPTSPAGLLDVLTSERDPVTWPPASATDKLDILEKVVIKCAVTNDGGRDLIDVKINIRIRYSVMTNSAAKFYDAPIVITPLLKGETIPLYVMNSCPVDVQVFFPPTGTARPSTEEAQRQFTFIYPTEGSNTGWQISAVKTNWRGNGCEF